VAALVGADRDAVGVLVDGRAHDVGDAAVVAEVDDLGSMRLEDPPDDVDGGVMAIEQRGRADEAQRGVGGGALFGARSALAAT
jgi:hypothetical protein